MMDAQESASAPIFTTTISSGYQPMCCMTGLMEQHAWANWAGLAWMHVHYILMSPSLSLGCASCGYVNA